MENKNYNEYLEIVLKALKPLTDEEKDYIFCNLKINEIHNLLTKGEEAGKYLTELRNTIFNYMKFHEAICKMFGFEPLKRQTIAEEYKELDAEGKFDTALALMNESDFQKDCSEILFADMKRIVESDPTLSAINKLFNITGYYEKAIKLGIGCDHKYIVEK